MLSPIITKLQKKTNSLLSYLDSPRYISSFSMLFFLLIDRVLLSMFNSTSMVSPVENTIDGD